MNKKSLIIILAIIVLGGGISYALVNSNNDKKSAENAAMMKKDEEAKMVAKEKEDTAMKKEHEDEAMKKENAGTGDVMIKGSYTDYDTAKLANAEKGKVILFFHAPWCPTCKEADKNFNASATPDGITLLKTDYDSSNDLKKKYGITYQHTFVQVDKDGNLIKKWSGSTSYDQLKAEVI